MTRILSFLSLGALFGFLLTRAEATEYNRIAGMFLFKDMHLAGVMGVAIAVAAIGLRLLKSGTVKPLGNKKLDVQKKPYHKYQFVAGITFGVGWALTGACPGTALAQVGQLKVQGIVVTLGILTGVFAYLKQQKPPQTAEGAAQLGDHSPVAEAPAL
ncbi:MAG: YeeE/YedE thiosulfate transporter family protein [Planctomycetota bacterium]|nr:YeeE/YedE thiosulfate transporter family protein [Planctomycetota bacterium]